MDRTIQTDVLVIGGGQAGFFAAMKAQEAISLLPTAELLTVHQLLPCRMYSLISQIKMLSQK